MENEHVNHDEGRVCGSREAAAAAAAAAVAVTAAAAAIAAPPPLMPHQRCERPGRSPFHPPLAQRRETAGLLAKPEWVGANAPSSASGFVPPVRPSSVGRVVFSGTRAASASPRPLVCFDH